jgi:adenylate kinase family enzyme
MLDIGLSRKLIEIALSSTLNSVSFNLERLLSEQLRNKDDLGNEMIKIIESGEMLSTDILGKFISRNLKSCSEDILLSTYPRTPDQYKGLLQVLKDINVEFQNI